MKAKIVRKIPRLVDRTLGFPIILENVTVVDIGGEECLDVNYGALSEKLLLALCLAPGVLSGNHLRFMREFAGFTQEEFARQFKVSRQVVSKWENCGEEGTKISHSTELLIRIWCAERIAKNAGLFKRYCHIIMRLDDIRQTFRLMYDMSGKQLRTA